MKTHDKQTTRAQDCLLARLLLETWRNSHALALPVVAIAAFISLPATASACGHLLTEDSGASVASHTPRIAVGAGVVTTQVTVQLVPAYPPPAEDASDAHADAHAHAHAHDPKAWQQDGFDWAGWPRPASAERTPICTTDLAKAGPGAGAPSCWKTLACTVTCTSSQSRAGAKPPPGRDPHAAGLATDPAAPSPSRRWKTWVVCPIRR